MPNPYGYPGYSYPGAYGQPAGAYPPQVSFGAAASPAVMSACSAWWQSRALWQEGALAGARWHGSVELPRPPSA